MQRREFLQQSLAAGAAVTLSAAALRAQSAPAAKVTLAVMGTNGRGHALATGFARLPGVQVAYVCDVDSRATAKTAKALTESGAPAPKEIVDFRKALDDNTVDALVIAAPDHWHAPATILACDAGKHVYVEKPACHNPREGELMVAMARKRDRRVQLGTQRRSSPRYKEAIERVHAGELGKVLMARGWINSTRPNIGRGRQTAYPNWLNYELWQGPAPERPYQDNLIHYNWHWFWHWGTGELGNNGIHALDVCRWGIQAPAAPAVVTCGGGKFHFDDDQETPDTQLATFNYGDKLISWEHRTWNKRGIEGTLWGIAFYGEKANLLLDDKSGRFYDMDGKLREELPMGGGEVEHLMNFLDAVREGKPLNNEIENGVASTLLCHLGNIALRTGRTLHCDPKTGRILNDEAAMQLWSREYRPGWEPKV